MRLAVLSDIHANPIALDAVLGDIEAHGGVDGYWVLGDLVAQGYDPAAVLRRLTALPDTRFVRGNTDRYTLTGERARPSVAEAQSDPALVPVLVAVAQGFAWTHGYLAATGWIDWVAALPLEERTVLPDGTRLLGVHAAPGTDDGPGVAPDTSEEELQSLVGGCNADLICVGHTHRPSDRWVGDVRVVNVGSVSNPLPDASDPRASYALLEADEGGYRLTLHRVAYDVDAVVRAIHEHHMFPNPDWLARHFAGRMPAHSESPRHAG